MKEIKIYPFTSSILEKIKIHDHVYRNANLSVPPLRLTYSEHKQLVHEIENISLLQKDHDYDFIAMYSGVEIEVVTLIQ